MKKTSLFFNRRVILGIGLFLLLSVPGTAAAQDLGVIADASGHRVVFFDLASNTVVAAIPTGGLRPFGLAVTPDDKTLLVANTLSNSISFIDLTQSPPALIGEPLVIDSPCRVLGVSLTHDGRFALTTHAFCAASARVTSIDIATRTPISQISVGGGEAFDIALTKDNSKLLAATFGSYWTTSLSAQGVLSNQQTYLNAMGQQALNTLALTPNGQLALTTNLQSGTVSVLTIDPLNNITHTGTIITTGGAPGGLAIAPDGAHAYVAVNYSSGGTATSEIAVLAINGANVTDTGSRIPLPYSSAGSIGIAGIAITNDSKRAYVTNGNSGVVSVLDLATNTFTGMTIPVGGRPQEIALLSLTKSVAIDIKPGSLPNSINPKSNGVIPVAILTTATFDASTVSPATLRFGASGTEAAARHAALEDVDGDGEIDLLLHFNQQETGLNCGATTATLTGQTVSGQAIKGTDSIKTAGCK